MSTSDPYEVAVNIDGSLDLHLAADEVAARLGARPGERLRLIRSEEQGTVARRRKSVRGIGGGKVAPEDVLTWEDFEKSSQANVEALNRRLGTW